MNILLTIAIIVAVMFLVFVAIMDRIEIEWSRKWDETDADYDAQVLINFDSKDQAQSFLGWMCDGGGEQGFFMSSEHEQEPDRVVAGFRYDMENRTMTSISSETS